MAEVVRRANLSVTIMSTGLFYLQRLKQMRTGCKGVYGSGHRLFLAAMIVASKYLNDDTYDNKSWAQICHPHFKLVEINQMETELLSFLYYGLYIKKNDFIELLLILDAELARRAPARSPMDGNTSAGMVTSNSNSHFTITSKQAAGVVQQRRSSEDFQSASGASENWRSHEKVINRVHIDHLAEAQSFYPHFEAQDNQFLSTTRKELPRSSSHIRASMVPAIDHSYHHEPLNHKTFNITSSLSGAFANAQVMEGNYHASSMKRAPMRPTGGSQHHLSYNLNGYPEVASTHLGYSPPSNVPPDMSSNVEGYTQTPFRGPSRRPFGGDSPALPPPTLNRSSSFTWKSFPRHSRPQTPLGQVDFYAHPSTTVELRPGYTPSTKLHAGYDKGVPLYGGPPTPAMYNELYNTNTVSSTVPSPFCDGNVPLAAKNYNMRDSDRAEGMTARQNSGGIFGGWMSGKRKQVDLESAGP